MNQFFGKTSMKYVLVFLSWVTRTLPWLPARWRLLNWLKPKVKAYYRQPSESIVRLTCGYKMAVDKYDFVGRHIYITGEYETPTSRLFRELIQSGENILDIGANIGYFSLLSLSLVGPDGRVYAFEASPHIAAILKSNIVLNNIGSNFTLFELAVANKQGTLTFHEAQDDHLGISSIRDLGDRTRSSIVVPAIPIDKIAHSLRTIKLIKLDIEGAELLALEGMVGLLQRDKPYVIFELTDQYLRQVYGSQEEVIEFLKGLDYELFRIEHESLPKLTQPPTSQCNVLAAPIGSSIPLL